MSLVQNDHFQQDQFDSLWAQYEPVVRAGSTFADVDANAGPIVTLVARIKSEVSERLAWEAQRLPLLEDDVYRYPESTIHTTILYLSPYLEGGVNDRSLGLLSDVIYTTVGETPIFEYEAIGLGLFPTTVYAQLIMHDMPRLVNFRRALSKSMKNVGLTGGQAEAYERQLKWSLSFANVARFLQPVGGGIADHIASTRGDNFGVGAIDSLELVITDKYLSDAGTKVVSHISLGE